MCLCVLCRYGSGLQEFLILEYGSSLMTHERYTLLHNGLTLINSIYCSLWQLGAYYLSTCFKDGK